MNDWMLVDKEMFDLTGNTCDKIGVSYTGFKFQSSACNQAVQRFRRT